MSELVATIRDTMKAAGLAGFVLIGASCSGGGQEAANSTTTEQIATTTILESTTTTEEITDDQKEAFQCGMLEAVTAISSEQLEDKEPARIAMGFRYYHEVTNADGVFGTEVLYNPAVTKCDLPSGSSLRVLTTQVVMGNEGIDGFAATGVAIIEFLPDGKYGLR